MDFMFINNETTGESGKFRGILLRHELRMQEPVKWYP
jgi:hypothetical protein